ncbi:Gas vesicle structural protein [Streptomyces sp. ADI96-15]|uniref:gas vesicle protein GvpJ n=1 Tax=Streptomyces TaxID=1883 RepID=UPI0003C2F450|nr:MULTISPECIES: gas vesicle protein GvpJ [unclassified Streptomyces]ESP97051.1 gas vesicle synthesis-like protein [Streptomyces sp. GBA 94-10 4N24]ESQ03217.1 gas vesicle synthesis-like protein [Streptomyces sp. PVA_94-07]RPK69402.1 Gas vesicle structural protein [Streptomyces sp. ADI96-15]UZN61468.1 gas vesicle synthesis-like protein [Streptomyces sp. GBA 94-10 4N24]
MTTPAIYRDDLVCAPRAGTLYDTLELILDRGMVIDVFIRVSLVGIEILKIDARICVASVDTYLRFAEACNRLDLESDSHSRTVPELFGGSMAGAAGKAGAKRAASSVGGKVKGALGLDGEDDEADEADEAEEERAEKPRPRKKRASSSSSDRPRRRPARS